MILQPAKQANGNVVGGEGGGGGSGGGGGRHKKRVRQPHNTAERQRQKAVGRGEYIMENTQQEQNGGGHDNMNGYNNGYNEGQPNSIEMRRAYEQQQQQMQQVRKIF